MRRFNRLPAIALFCAHSLLLACSSSGGDGTTSFTVSTSVGDNGAISPASASVNQNDTTSFTVTPDTGYLIDTVGGCGGSLSGNTYTTGAITADCTVSASFVARTLGAVTALFPINAANWNDYVAGTDWLTATDIACAAAIDSACLHGGEHRVVEATGLTDCTGLTAADDLGAFNWVCDDSTGTARLISTVIADGKYLSDLLDFSTPGFRPNAVTVFENGVVWGTTPSNTWWTNPVVIDNSGGSLATESTIYLVTGDPVAAWTLDADKLAFVVQPGVSITGPGTNTNVIAASARDYLWLEGSINATGDGTGIRLSAVRFSVLRKLASDNTALGLVLLDHSSNNRLSDVKVSNNSIGISLENNSSNNTLSGLRLDNNGVGVRLSNASNDNTLMDIRASNNSSAVVLINVSRNTLSSVAASNNSTVGISLSDNSSNNTLSSVTVSNNQTGVLLAAASSNTLLGLTAGNNVIGVRLSVVSNNTLSAVAVTNSQTGILEDTSNNNTFSDMAASNNNDGISLFDDLNNTFTGLLEVGSNSSKDCFVLGGTNPGLVDTTCTINGSSDHTLVTGVSLANVFVGKVSSGDVHNTSDFDGAAIFPNDPLGFDWTDFDNAFRGWGIDGSDFPNVDHQDQWTTGGGRIWDWSVSTEDTGNGGIPALLDVLTLPTGNDTLTHRWNGSPVSNDAAGCDLMVSGSVWNSTDSVCETTHLRHAVEIQADGLGNDNTLCESGETCLYTPNIGSYQGHGGLISAGTFTAGTLSGITLMKYDSNGR